MNDLSYQGISHQFLTFHSLMKVHVVNRVSLPWCNSKNFIFDCVEAPPRQYQEMPSLWVFTYYSKDRVSCLVTDLKFLVDLCVAAAVQYCFLGYFSHETLLVLYVDCGSVIYTQTAVVISNAFVRRMLVIIEPCDAPRAV